MKRKTENRALAAALKKMWLRISDELELPIDFVTGTQGIVATKGKGKTHVAKVECEELLAHGQVAVVIDPTDAWWGLRSSADGRATGYPIVVIGGAHGDVKLEPDAGPVLARAIVEQRFSAVLCTRGLSDSKEVRFVREFLSTLYRLNREPLHVFVDEADMFAPQKPFDPEDAQSIRAMSNIVRRGRLSGIGCTMITQRPSVLNKDVLSQVDTMVVLGMSHNLDIEPIEKWMMPRKKGQPAAQLAAAALVDEMLASLPSLAVGDAWIWSPSARLHRRFRARPLRTFDSSATPKAGENRREAKVLAPVDVARLGDAIAATVQRQREEDPAHLRAELQRANKLIADLRETNDTLGRHAAQEESAARRAMDQSVTSVVDAFKSFEKQMGQLTGTYAQLQSAERNIGQMLRDWKASVALPVARAPAAPAPIVARKIAAMSNGHRPIDAAVLDAVGETLEPRQAKILAAISWWESVGIKAPNAMGVAFMADYSPSSSSYEKARGHLRSLGLIEYPSPGAITLTDAGRRCSPPPPRPATVQDLHAAVLDRLEPRQGKLLQPLLEQWPASMDAGALAAAAEYSPASSSYEKARGLLRSLGLVEYPKPGHIRATDVLFPGMS